MHASSSRLAGCRFLATSSSSSTDQNAHTNIGIDDIMLPFILRLQRYVFFLICRHFSQKKNLVVARWEFATGKLALCSEQTPTLLRANSQLFGVGLTLMF